MKVLETCVNPKLEAHKGWVEFVETRGDKVVLRFRGACSGCESVQETLSNIVIPAVKEKIPSAEISICEDTDPRLVEMAKKFLSKKQ